MRFENDVLSECVTLFFFSFFFPLEIWLSMVFIIYRIDSGFWLVLSMDVGIKLAKIY